MAPDPTPTEPPLSTRRSSDPETLLRAARAGDRGALGRLLSLVERGGAPARAIGRLTFPASADLDHVVGITGAPGVGKSTITDRMIAAARAEGRAVGVLAIDPSSPFSGGALLGDRVRMSDHALDAGVFVRSMATRGHLGGLSLAAPEAIRALGAAGIGLVLVETVGVGQVEVEISGAADTTLVVVNPGWGDAVQAAKAGLLEIADVFVVNKADRPGAQATLRDLEQMLDIEPDRSGWRPPIVLTTATRGEGVEQLWSAIGDHRAYLGSSGELDEARQQRLLEELAQVLLRRLERQVRSVAGGAAFERLSGEVVARRLDPYEAAERLLAGTGP